MIGEKFVCQRLVLFVTLLRNLLMNFGGISEQSSNVTINPVPDPRSSIVPSFTLQSLHGDVVPSADYSYHSLQIRIH